MSTIRSITLTVLVVGLLIACYSRLHQVSSKEEQDISQIEWWKKTNFYHIYLRSFKDSDGDGNGDLRGVIEKLDYLKQINVETILMAPFYASPMKDGGYDTSDYVALNPMFGTMEDFEELLSELHKRNMRMLVDFVPNHSSNKHKWFECSERAFVEPERCGKYKDYYVWTNSTRYQGKYPSNWISVFGGTPAWQWSELRQQFYLHQFLPEQPDLNFRSPGVREEFKEVIRFWLRKGADGIRVDSAIYLVEDEQMRDEPPSPKWKPGDDPADRLSHIHTRALHESAEIVGEWHRVAQEPEFSDFERIIITEAYDEIPKLIEYYGTSPQDVYADMPFNFELFKLKEQNLDSEFVEKVALGWIEPARALGWPDEHGAISPWHCWVTGNHDNKRMANRIGYANVPFFKWLTYLLPGVPINYYGDELTIHDTNYNSIPEKTLREGEPTRLPFRAPMAWTAEEPAGGFSNTSDIWLPLNADYRSNNVEFLLSDKSHPKNHLKLYLQLERIRQDRLSLFVFGDLVFFRHDPPESKAIFALARTHDKFGNLLMLVNFDQSSKSVVHLRPNESVLRHEQKEPPKRGKVIMSNFIDMNAPALKDGAEVDLEGLSLASLQAVLIEY